MLVCYLDNHFFLLVGLYFIFTMVKRIGSKCSLIFLDQLQFVCIILEIFIFISNFNYFTKITSYLLHRYSVIVCNVGTLYSQQ